MAMKIFVGWDQREDIAYQVAKFSIEQRTKHQIEIFPIKQEEMRAAKFYTREVDKMSTTEFTFTRFLVPYLSGYKGWSLFIDCDFLIQIDIKELFDLADDKYAIMCAKHDHTPKETMKMDDQVQRLYPRKNWSSCVLYNCAHPANRALNIEMINKETGLFLHRFHWLTDDLIGEFSHEYNWLEGWYKEPEDGTPKIIHYTRGGPWFYKDNYPQWHDVDYADEWLGEREKYLKHYWSLD